MSTSAEIVELMKSAIAGAPGVSEIKVDGMEIKIDSSELDKWEKKAAREATPNKRPIVNTIDLSGF